MLDELLVLIVVEAERPRHLVGVARLDEVGRLSEVDDVDAVAKGAEEVTQPPPAWTSPPSEATNLTATAPSVLGLRGVGMRSGSLTDQIRSLTPMCDMVSTRKSLYGFVSMTSGTGMYGLMYSRQCVQCLTIFTAADVEKRATEIALTTADNARKKIERDSTMRDYKNRLAAIVIASMRETALNTLLDLKARFEDTTVSGMYDGPAMLDDMRTKAKAELAAGDDETEKKAVAELEGTRPG